MAQKTAARNMKARTKTTPKKRTSGGGARSKEKSQELKPDPRNARLRTPRSEKMIEQSLREVGAFRSIAIDGDGIIRAGNGVAEAAKKLGMKIRVIKANGNELIAVQRDDLTGKKAERAALFDNRTGELSVWDPDVLLELSAPLLAGIFEAIELPGAQIEFSEAPQTVKENIDHIAEIKKQRKKGNEATVRKDDTERYLIIVYPSRELREKTVELMGLPKDERYLPSESIELKLRIKPRSLDAIAQPAITSGAQGGTARKRQHRA